MFAAIALSTLFVPASDEVVLERKFKAGERLEYAVSCSLQMEFKTPWMQFYMPEEFGVDYRFVTRVVKLLHDGYARISYERPTMTFVEGETAQRPPKKTVEQSGWKLELDLSPINEVTKVKDLSPKRPRAKGDGKSRESHAPGRQDASDDESPNPLLPIVQEIRSLALFLGDLDSSLDLNPKLPIDPVTVGATWKKTVSYQPRKLADSDRQAMQRLDMTYQYDGLVQSENRSVRRVSATVDLDTDAAPWLNQVMGQKPEESNLAAVKLRLKTKIEFDLDPTTLTTLRAGAVSEGEVTITVDEDKSRPAYTERLKGKSEMRLVSRN
jgi:hypothetical protein